MICGWLVLLTTAVPGIDQDAVTYSTGRDLRGQAVVRGVIEDFAAGQLTIRTDTGRRQAIPANRIINIDTHWQAQHIQADELAAKGQYGEAANLYLQAYRAESRPWAQRQIVAGMIRSLEHQRRYETAGDGFLSLIRSDPQTHFFSLIPLAWRPQAITPALEQKAMAWLQTEDQPVAMLMGASWLLAMSSHQAAARQTLQRLSTDADPRIAHLASAQSWRLAIVTANDQQVKRWQAAVERIPEPLRAGPYFVLGQAQARLGQSVQAALSFMRVPILYRENHDLASQALLAAAAELTKLGRIEQAHRLLREVVRDFPSTQAASEAQGLLNRVDGASG